MSHNMHVGKGQIKFFSKIIALRYNIICFDDFVKNFKDIAAPKKCKGNKIENKQQ